MLTTIGNDFPELRYFRLVSYSPFGITPALWSTFLSHHTKLQVLDLNHAHFGLHASALDFSLLKLSELTLGDFHLADPDGKFAAWIRDNRLLETLDIELSEAVVAVDDHEPAQVRDRLLQAIADNASLSTLRLKGEAWITDGDGTEPCDSFMSLIDSIGSHPRLIELQIPAFGIRVLEDFLNGADRLRESPLAEKLEALESLQPALKLTLGEFEMNTLQYQSTIDGRDLKLLDMLQGWPMIVRLPEKGEALKFTISMPVWGNGAFGRFMKFCSLAPDRQLRYLIFRARQGHLVDGSLQTVRSSDRNFESRAV